MTISQALRRIAKVKGQLKEQLARAEAAVTYPENEPPAFAFAASFEMAQTLSEELIRLETALRVANATTQVVGKSITLAEATCRLTELKARIAWLRGLHVQAQESRKVQSGHSYDAERRLMVVYSTTLCALPEAKRAAMVEAAQAEFDALNDAVETTNHRAEIKL